jgi:signal transduction histidine kinase
VQTLAAGIAHDFNNLLTGIIGNASLIGEDLPPESRSQEFLDDLTNAAKRTAELTAQLLEYSGRARFGVCPVDLSELISGMKTQMRASVSRNIAIQFELAERLLPVEGDSNQLRRLIMALIYNGAEAIGEGRHGCVTVHTAAGQVDEGRIHAAFADVELAPGEYVCVEVRDDGCGMDEDTCRRLFEPFFTTKFLGRGLGLAAAMGIIKGHHGAISVQSTPGQGSTFQVFLPAAPATPVETTTR